MPLGRDLGIECIRVFGQPADVLAGDVVKIEIAVQRNQQFGTVGRPLIIHDAVEAGDTRAFAARLFRIRQMFTVGLKRLRIHQQARGVVGEVVLPEIELILVVALAAQERDARSVRCDLHVARRRAGECRIGVDAFDRQLFRVRGRCAGHHEGCQQDKTEV